MQRRALNAVARMMVKESKSGAEFPLAQRFWCEDADTLHTKQGSGSTAMSVGGKSHAAATQHLRRLLYIMHFICAACIPCF